MAVDATGVGQAVVDLIRLARPGCRVIPVVVTGGEKESLLDGYYGVPKKDLIMGLQVMLQMGELEVAAGLKHYEDLLAEMAAVEVRVTQQGREQYGAWREGTHDDLVFAVALAIWALRKSYPRRVGGNGWWQNEYQDDAGRLVLF
jgi:threonine dehydrogenase-like Zn-dependent dehydrogenase